MSKPVKGTAVAKSSSRNPYQKAGPTSKSDHKVDNDHAKAKSKSVSKEPPVEDVLNVMFDELLSEDDKDADKSENTMFAASSQAYIQRLGASAENYEMFVVLDIVNADALGQISRAGFVEGWARQRVPDIGKKAGNEKTVPPNLSAHQQHVRYCCDKVTTDPAYFKTLYQRAFLAGREPQQKSVNMEVAIVFWGMMFEPTMRSWRSAKVDWLQAWTDYLTEKFYIEDGDKSRWTRTVSRDLWTQTALFAAKTMEDELLSFWSEEQAWPGLIDEFVVWCRDKHFVATKDTEDMEVDE
ncbi:Defective in cullin neddylation protein 1 [Madurella mycetomatis]|uniref:Defective in cullin neddylation protein n=1 Tax=Madurella mycetomatis TaxID=100816 RepID=A0A175WHF8_9PEZI|nr:Defective in cullin neddylation protein 1 [Madurella mycetomatis]